MLAWLHRETTRSRSLTCGGGDEITLIDQDKFARLGSVINDKLLQSISKRAALPKIEESRLVGGAAKIKCGDLDTRRWLVHTVSMLSDREVWPNAKLTVVDFGDIPKPHKFVAWFPGNTKSAADIFRIIEALNPGISTASWSVLNREPKVSGTSMVIGVGSDSVAELQNRSNSLYCGMGKATFKYIKGKPATK